MLVRPEFNANLRITDLSTPTRFARSSTLSSVGTLNLTCVVFVEYFFGLIAS